MTLCSGQATLERRMLQIPSQWCPMSTLFTGETCTEGMRAKRRTVTHKGKEGKVTTLGTEPLSQTMTFLAPGPVHSEGTSGSH